MSKDDALLMLWVGLVAFWGAALITLIAYASAVDGGHTIEPMGAVAVAWGLAFPLGLTLLGWYQWRRSLREAVNG